MNNKRLLFVKLINEIDEYRFIFEYYDVIYQYDCTDDYWHTDRRKLKDSDVLDKVRFFELEMAASNMHLAEFDFPKELYREMVKAVFKGGNVI